MEAKHVRGAATTLLVLTLGCSAATTPAPAPEYDLVIRGGTVYDGTGAPGRVADVAITGDRIAAVGDLSSFRGRREVDARGLAVAPGFINMLSWATTSLLRDGRSQSDIRQGVTLEVFGEGSSMGPWSEAMKAENLARQGDLKYDIEWTTLGEYLEHLERQGVSTNVASFVGATTVRVHEVGYDDRPPTPAELERMRALVRQAMEEGALGVGSSLIYAPAFYADTDELIALAGETARYGGMYISHLRSEGNALLPAVDELITIAREAGLPAEIYHLKQAGTDNWPKLDSVIARVEAARREGLRITTDMYTYTAGATGLDAAMPPWVQEGGFEAWKARLQDPAIRARLLEEMRTPTDEWESLYLLAGSPERVLVVGFEEDSLRHLTGKSLAEVARMRGTSPEETAIDLVIQNDNDVGTVYFLMSEENVRRQITLPWMSFGSDAGSLAPEGAFLRSNPHPRAYGNFARLLGRYVRDEGLIPLEEAIRRLTSLPASNLGIRGRGELRPGFFADVVVFDPAEITDHATFEDPHQYATGVRHVFVNGSQVLRDGEHTGATPGRVVRGPGWVGWRDGALPPLPGSAVPAAARTPPDFEALRRRIETRAASAPGEVSVALMDLETGARIGVNDGVEMHAASTMKVPVLVELFRQSAAGRAALGDSIVVRNAFTSIADGSRYSLTPEDDSEQALYRMEGRRVTREELARRMIARSSNLATNILIEEVGAEAVRDLMAAMGAERMRVLRGVEDIPAYRRGMNNTTTAAALARVLEAIARCEAGSVDAPLRPLAPSDCGRITAMLEEQHFTDRIPAALPRGTRVANKTGWITAIDHDAAIIYPPGRAPYVLVVLTRGMEDDEVSARTIRDISGIAWDELGTTDLPTGPGAAPAELASLHAAHQVSGLEDRKFGPDAYWAAVLPLIERSGALDTETVGESVEGRPIRAVSYGSGPTTVLLWSQMHGDEPTASMALADIFAFLAAEDDHPLAARIRDRLTVVAVPMLNPDGAHRFQRRNAMGIDINRDARSLATPEARALKGLRDRLRPEFGFNLHDQNVRTRVGRTPEGAAIALLAPPWSESRDDDVVRERAKQVAAVIRLAVDSLVAGRVTRYDDTYNPRAFGDLMQQWGTSTVLIEAGGWDDDPEKQHLRAASFVGILAALDAIATETYASVPTDWYETLPLNGPAAADLILRGGTVVAPGIPPFPADIAVEYRESSRLLRPRVSDIGDLAESIARRELDIAGLYAHVETPANTDSDEADGDPLGPITRIVVRQGPEPTSRAIWIVADGGAVRASP